MFDTVIIDGLKLKSNSEIKEFLRENNSSLPTEFQTKDLDPGMTTYKINECGQIFKQIYKPTGKKIPYDAPFRNFRDNRSFLEKLYWKVKLGNFDNKESEKLVDELKPTFVKDKLTQTITIYTLEEIGKRYLSLDYSVKIVDGKIKSHKLLNYDIESVSKSQERHKDNQEFKEKMDAQFKARNELTSKWYYPFLKEIYNPFVFFTTLSIRFICNKLVTLTYRWHGI